MNIINLLDFKSFGDERGNLIAIENDKNIPFDIKRVYYLFGTAAGESRGFHAHKELRQVAICIVGKCTFIMNDGVMNETIMLNNPAQGLLIDKMQWHEMHDFSDDCVLLVLASDTYDESDYIRNYTEFLKEVDNASV